ncbi:MAG: 50S ribosomal protein L25/general stress protein Ctc [Deltaproteobacteria bacterium]|nr:50S ribosomal protein L25/general stress protein Ctc [Deltaproteobacteria bacterium]
MEQIELKANARKTTGNGPAGVLRREGRIPAVLYGPGTEPVLLSVKIVDFEEVLKKGNVSQVLLNLVIQNGKAYSKSVIIKELQQHPVSQDFLHIDFYEIDMKRKIKVNIPVATTGKSKGVELGGVLQIVRHELEVLCLPGDIPEEIVIDVTDLDMGDSVHVEEIPLEGDAEIQAEINFTVLTILSPKVEEEEVEEEEELEEGEEGAEEGAEEGEETSEPDKEE